MISLQRKGAAGQINDATCALMEGLVEPNASTGTFDDQLRDGETESYTTDVRS